MVLHSQRMKCPACTSTRINKNGRRRAKPSYRCKDCGRQFVESYSSRGYSSDAKQICLNLHRHGMGFRAIERATGVSHNTVINWVREEESMPLDVAEPAEATALESLHEPNEEDLLASEEALLALQPVEGWLTYVRRNVHEMSMLSTGLALYI